jgi:uncharacterized membrane protein
MNRRGLKQASRQCLRDAVLSPTRLTLLFMLCSLLISIPADLLSHVFETCIDELTGLGSIALRNRYNLWTIVLVALADVLLLLWDAGYTAYAMRLSRGQRADFDDFLTGLRMFGKVLCVELLMFFYIWLWSMLFVIPGVIAAYRYRMALYIQLDHPEYSASACIDLSKQLTAGHKTELFTLDLSFLWYYLLMSASSVLMLLYTQNYLPLSGWGGFLAVYFAGVAADLVFSLLWMPYVETTLAHAYNWLLSLREANPPAEQPPAPENPGL